MLNVPVGRIGTWKPWEASSMQELSTCAIYAGSHSRGGITVSRVMGDDPFFWFGNLSEKSGKEDQTEPNL